MSEWEDAANASTSAGAGRPPAAPSRVLVNRSAELDRRVQGRDDVEKKQRQSLRSIAESMSMARETAHTISMQSEQLGRTERAVDEAQYTVDLSKRIMRGMTWSGWIANAFSTPPPTPDHTASNGSKTPGKPDAQITMGFICPECKVVFKNGEELALHYSKAHAEATNEPSPSHEPIHSSNVSRRQAQSTLSHATDGDIHEAFLRQLEPQLAELKEVSCALGNALDTQNRQLDRLDDKVDRVHDGVKRVSVQAKKLTGRRLPVVFRYRCVIQEVETRRFIRDVNGEPVLGADVVGDGCTFRAYTLGEDTEMWGFQSESSSFFLGINRLGALKVRGSDFNSYEQFAIETRKPTTTIFAYASYFGYGGWVVRKDEDKLTIVRGSPENKHGAAQFKIVNLDQIQSELAPPS